MKLHFTGDEENIGRRLIGIYVRTTALYLLAMALLWVVGIEGIYGHPTPFYALFSPTFDSAFTPRAVLAFILVLYLVLGGRIGLKTALSSWRIAGVILMLGFLLVYVVHLEVLQLDKSMPMAISRIWIEFRWHLLALSLFSFSLIALIAWLRRSDGFEEGSDTKDIVWLLMALVAFSALFATSIAMLRGGPEAIAQAYDRQAHEYIGDIGKTTSIRSLFGRYIELHPNLSMHAKVHPPGPIALLWLFSYAIGQDSMPLSLATIAFGALGIVPLYLWTREITNQRTAITCCLLYSVIPSIVLFTATSADILFTPFTLMTLYLFDRAIRRCAGLSAIAAGIGFGMMAHLKFSLLAFGAYFALVGLWFLTKKETRINVVLTAALMITGFIGTILAVRWWSGFDIIAVFEVSKAQFDLDQYYLDQLQPRLSPWIYRFLNPASWFFFAGIPVSLLCFWRLFRPDPKTKSLFIVFAFTILALNLLYLARGEGERSALYLFPFLALPAAHALNQLCQSAKSHTPLTATLAFMAFQCWLTESLFYTYW